MVISDSPNGGSTPPPPPQQEQANKDRFTKPISLAGPTDSDLHRNTELEKVDSSLHSIVYFHAFALFLCIQSNENFICFFFLLLQFLVDSGLYESNEEAASRQEVLRRLDQVIYYFLDFDFPY
jgi:poly(A) polymerase